MRIVAAVDVSPTAEAVLDVATALGARLDADVVALHADEAHARTAPSALVRVTQEREVELLMVPGRAAAAVVEMLSAEDVLIGVIGSRGRAEGKLPAGHIATAVASAVTTPLVVVPPTAHGGDIRRVLVPLEAAPTGAAAVSPLVDRLARGGVEVVPLHVFVPATVPPCWDQPQHASRAWSAAFLARYAPATARELRLRGGDVVDALLDVVSEEAVDLVALTWSQDLTGSHAPVVRALLARCPVPVALVPIATGG